MDAVKLALGDTAANPRDESTPTRPGSTQVWHYTTYEDSSGVIIYSGYYHRWGGWGGPRVWGDVGYYNGYPVRVHDRIRVEFDSNMRVASIQQEKT